MDQISALCPAYCISYALKSVDMKLKIGQFLGFHDILTSTTPNLYTVHASKLKPKLFIWGEFY